MLRREAEVTKISIPIAQRGPIVKKLFLLPLVFVLAWAGFARPARAQEETRNRGGWAFMMPRLMELFPDQPVKFVGREPSASPATGSSSIHKAQQAELVREALEISSD